MKDGYNTKQRKLILACLKREKNRHLTAEDLAALLDTAAPRPGIATIYRTLDKLVHEGQIRKYAAGGVKEKSCYQFIDTDSLCSEHYHLKCTGCGKLIHLECKKVNSLVVHIKQDHNFTLDTNRTVLYGLCSLCSNAL